MGGMPECVRAQPLAGGGVCRWESPCFWGREQQRLYHPRPEPPGHSREGPQRSAAAAMGGRRAPCALLSALLPAALLSSALLASHAFPQTNIKISQGECRAWGAGGVTPTPRDSGADLPQGRRLRVPSLPCLHKYLPFLEINFPLRWGDVARAAPGSLPGHGRCLWAGFVSVCERLRVRLEQHVLVWDGAVGWTVGWIRGTDRGMGPWDGDESMGWGRGTGPWDGPISYPICGASGGQEELQGHTYEWGRTAATAWGTTAAPRLFINTYCM